VCGIDAVELGAIRHTFSASPDDDRIRTVTVEQDDLRLARSDAPETLR